MKSIIKITLMLLVTAIIGCSEEDKPVKTADSTALKTEIGSLEKAKAIEQTVLDAAAREREQIERSAQ